MVFASLLNPLLSENVSGAKEGSCRSHSRGIRPANAVKKRQVGPSEHDKGALPVLSRRSRMRTDVETHSAELYARRRLAMVLWVLRYEFEVGRADEVRRSGRRRPGRLFCQAGVSGRCIARLWPSLAHQQPCKRARFARGGRTTRDEAVPASLTTTNTR